MDTDELNAVECPACGSPDVMHLGCLGNLDHFRCCDCGADFSVEDEQ